VNEPQDKDRFLHTVKSTLDRSVDELDDATRRQLCEARRQACQVASKETARGMSAWSTWWLPVGGLAAVATIAVFAVSLWLLPAEDGLQGQLPAEEDIALLGDAESLEFYENLDFYLWLDDEQKAG